MNRTTAIMGFAVPLLAVAIGGCGSDTGEAPRPADRVEVIELGVRTDQYETLDLGTPGPSLGDLDVYSGSAVKDGKTIWRGGGSCQATNIDGPKVTTNCVITMALDRGSVTVQALWVKGESPLDMAVTGGTGAYREARGTVRFWDIATPNERIRAEIVH